ncbi:IS66 family transposase, partial [Streptococcus suis]
ETKKRRWLFSQSFEGAKSTAIILSLLETAKRHGLEAEKYMTYLLEHCNRPITRYLSTHSLLQYTVRKTKLE